MVSRLPTSRQRPVNGHVLVDRRFGCALFSMDSFHCSCLYYYDISSSLSWSMHVSIALCLSLCHFPMCIASSEAMPLPISSYRYMYTHIIYKIYSCVARVQGTFTKTFAKVHLAFGWLMGMSQASKDPTGCATSYTKYNYVYIYIYTYIYI